MDDLQCNLSLVQELKLNQVFVTSYSMGENFSMYISVQNLLTEKLSELLIEFSGVNQNSYKTNRQ